MRTSVSSGSATSTSGVRDGALQGASDAEDLGFAVRVIHRGAWGFASGGGADARGGGPGRRARGRGGARSLRTMTSTPVEIAPEPVYDDVTWISSYDVNPLEVPTAEKAALLIDWTEPAAHRRRRRPRVGVPPAGAGEQVLRRPGGHPHHPAAGPGASRVRGDGQRRGPLRLDVVDRAAGWPRLGVPHRRQLGLGRRDRPGPGAAGREAQGPERRGRHLRPGHPPLEPLAHHPRVDRTRHRAGPCAGLRGQLRGHVVRDLRQARHPPVRLAGHERHRRPHRRARPRDGRLRRRGRADPVVGHRQGRPARRLPARPGDGPHEARAQRAAAPTAARTPTPPATSRSSGWPTCPCNRRRTGPRPRS